MSDEADLLAQVVAALEAMGVPCMVGGSVALAVWAQPRLTHDLDLVVPLDHRERDAFCLRGLRGLRSGVAGVHARGLYALARDGWALLGQVRPRARPCSLAGITCNASKWPNVSTTRWTLLPLRRLTLS